MLKRLGLPAMLVVLALVFLAGRGLLDRMTQSDATGTVLASVQPDYTMDRLHTRRFDVNGRLARDLAADRLEHYPDARGSLLTNPLLTAHAERGEPWLIRAREGHSPPGEEEVNLKGRVRIDRAKGAQNDELHLTTETLRVLPEKNFAETGDPATITSQGMRSTGIGLNAWLDKEQLQLLDNVRGQYEGKSHSGAHRP